MQRAIQLGRNALGSAAPNPMVGCVIVCDGKIIGEGFTSPPGGPHAEVNAIASVADKSLLKKATLYVTLEPCSHFGKTPPCADLIVKHQIPKVMVGLTDPYPEVAGRGIQRLQDSGCTVQQGILETECREHHRRFLTFHEKKRPYLILKWAQSADGFMAPAKEHRASRPEPFWITAKASRQLVHKWRSEEAGILAGTKTVLEDDPRLDVRLWHGKNPVRLVLDRKLHIPKEYHVTDGSTATIILTEITDATRYLEQVDYEVVDFTDNLAHQIAKMGQAHNFLSILIEGGAATLGTFIEADLWDEARIFTGALPLGKGLEAPLISGHQRRTAKIGQDTLTTIRHD